MWNICLTNGEVVILEWNVIEKYLKSFAKCKYSPSQEITSCH